MTSVIVATSIREQQDIMAFLRDKLKEMYLTDTSIIVVRFSMSRMCVYQHVNGVKVLASSYDVVLVPVTMGIDNIRGFSHKTNIDITRLLKRLDSMKSEAIAYVNSHKLADTNRNSKEALARAAKKLFE